MVDLGPAGQAKSMIGLPGRLSMSEAWATLARLAPALPFVLMLLILVLRPQGLLGRPSA